MTDPKEPVFPGPPWDGTLQAAVTPRGLTKREYFAAMAMQGMVTLQIEDWDYSGTVAEEAVKMADALIAELSK